MSKIFFRLIFRIFLRLFFLALFGANLLNGSETMQNPTFLAVNGVQIPVIHEISRTLPLGSVSVIFKGAGRAYVKKPALAAIATDILNRGTKAKGEYAFANELESSAIGLSVGDGLEDLGFHLDFLRDKEAAAIALLGELLSDPNVSAAALKQAKLAAKSQLLGLESDFDYIASANLDGWMFKNTALESPKLGTIGDVEALRLSDVAGFIKDSLVLSNARILIGGDLDLEKTLKRLESILSPLPKGVPYTPIKIAPNAAPRTISSIKPTKQAYIYFAAPFHFEGFENALHKAQVMSFIMGSSGFGSRMMEEIRVKRGLAYSAYFYHQINNVSALSMGYLQTKLENKDEAIAAVREVVAALLKGDVAESELADAKSYILGSRVLSDETLQQRLNKKYANFNRGLPLDFDRELVRRIQDLSLAELNAYIAAHSEIGELSFSIVVDK